MFGAQWHETVPLIQVLCAGAAIAALGNFNSLVLMAAGAVRQYLALTTSVLILNVLLIGIGSLIGIAAVAVAIAAVNIASLFISYRAVRRIVGVGLSDVVRTSGKSALVAGAAASGPAIIRAWPIFGGVWSDLALAAAAAVSAWITALFVLRHPLSQEVALLFGALGDALRRTFSRVTTMPNR
jgi:O-antigen/teichoic acid export membrane protein